MSNVSIYPACGLYRTSTSLPGHEDAVPAGRLVYFHNHSDEGPPMLLMPRENQRNKWHFHQHGHLIRDDAFLSTLRPLLKEGLYRLREHFHVDGGRIVAKHALAQLGYNADAEPILFFSTPHPDQNGIRFPNTGFKISALVYGLLEPLDVRGPYVPTKRHLH